MQRGRSFGAARFTPGGRALAPPWPRRALPATVFSARWCPFADQWISRADTARQCGARVIHA